LGVSTYLSRDFDMLSNKAFEECKEFFGFGFGFEFLPETSGHFEAKKWFGSGG
jgi:hypothetical protein